MTLCSALQNADITAKKLKKALEKELTSGSDAAQRTWKKIKPIASKGERGVSLSWFRRKEGLAKADQAAPTLTGNLVAAFHNDCILYALLHDSKRKNDGQARVQGEPSPTTRLGRRAFFLYIFQVGALLTSVTASAPVSHCTPRQDCKSIASLQLAEQEGQTLLNVSLRG